MAEITGWADREIRLQLDSGENLLLRPITMADKPLIDQGIHELSKESRYSRFFFSFDDPSETMLNLLASVNGVTHIAWCAIDQTTGTDHPVAAVHAIRHSAHDTDAEIACTVIDEFHGKGISHLLMAAVASDCQHQNISVLYAEVLRRNAPAQKLFRSFATSSMDESETSEFRLEVDDFLEKLEQRQFPTGVSIVLERLR